MYQNNLNELFRFIPLAEGLFSIFYQVCGALILKVRLICGSSHLSGLDPLSPAVTTTPGSLCIYAHFAEPPAFFQERTIKVQSDTSSRIIYTSS